MHVLVPYFYYWILCIPPMYCHYMYMTNVAVAAASIYLLYIAILD